MTKIIKVIGNILIAPVAALFVLIALMVGVGFLLLYILPMRALAAVMRAARKDPKAKLEIAEANDSNWQTCDTTEEFIESFNRLLKVIATVSSASISQLKKFGFDDIPPRINDSDHQTTLRLERTLQSAHGSLVATLEFIFEKYNDSYFTALEDDESRAGSGFPELKMVWKSNDDHRLVFTTSTDESLWFAIGLLNSGLKISEAHQAWVKLQEKGVWLVNYTIIYPHKSDTLSYRYGLRSDFSDKRVREFLLDK